LYEARDAEGGKSRLRDAKKSGKRSKADKSDKHVDKHKKKKRSREPTDSSSSEGDRIDSDASSSDDDSDSDQGVDESTKRARVDRRTLEAPGGLVDSPLGISVGASIGPALPSAAQLNQGQILAKKYIDKVRSGHIVDGEDEDSEDELGPCPQTAEERQRSMLSALAAQQTPLGGSIQVAHGPGVDTRGLGTDGALDAAGAAPDPNAREEWMLTPGENKALSDLDGIGGGFGKGRGFQTGKGAKKAAQEYSAIREHREKLAQKQIEEVDPEVAMEREAQLEAEREARGPSLMDLHMAKKKQEKASGSSGGRRAFDYEKDVLSRRQVGSTQAAEMVENAKQLDTRFDRGSVQGRSF
jgi:hypothetical protein